MYAERMGELPPYLFARIDEMKAAKIRSGADVIDLGVGDPDLPTPAHIVEALCEAAHDPQNHHYPSYAGMEVVPDSGRRLVQEPVRCHALIPGKRCLP